MRVPTTHGTPSSRATIAAWHVIPPRSVTNAAASVEIHAYWGGTDATQDDVVLGEGQAMVFIPRDQVLDRELSVASSLVLRRALAPDAVGR